MKTPKYTKPEQVTEFSEKTLPAIDTCTWCERTIVKPVGDGFLTGVFGYGYCSSQCMENHINSK